jgi:hypothetical protein
MDLLICRGCGEAAAGADASGCCHECSTDLPESPDGVATGGRPSLDWCCFAVLAVADVSYLVFGVLVGYLMGAFRMFLDHSPQRDRSADGFAAILLIVIGAYTAACMLVGLPLAILGLWHRRVVCLIAAVVHAVLNLPGLLIGWGEFQRGAPLAVVWFLWWSLLLLAILGLGDHRRSEERR